jgi:nitroimidazol reductase NimA-like FMN-containing flavoprotein (pyridoxamine 5'-phosphate oxidase superfamily)
MVIREMNRDECEQVLARTRLARLGCAQDNQPYVVPVTLAYHRPEYGDPCLYGVTIPGQKVEWMRANPLVCVEVDDIAADDRWVSVVVNGRYEELPETVRIDDGRRGDRKLPVHFPDRSDLARVDGAAMLGTRACDVTAGTMPFEGSRIDDDGPEPQRVDDERLRAYEILSSRPAWWERGWASWLARPKHKAEEYRIIYYKITIGRITGREATPVARVAISHASRQHTLEAQSPSHSKRRIVMNRILLLGVLISAALLVGVRNSTFALPPELPKQATPKVDSKPGEPNLRNLPTRKEAMDMKLKSSQAILAGIALNDFEKIQTAANELITVSNVNDFLNAYKGAEYQFHMQLFRRPVEMIVTKAKDKNMDGVLVAYTDMTLSCLKCHQAMRDNKFEIALDRPGK